VKRQRIIHCGADDDPNPDAVTQIANGLSTSTFAYDASGNLVQKTTDGTTTNAGGRWRRCRALRRFDRSAIPCPGETGAETRNARSPVFGTNRNSD